MGRSLLRTRKAPPLSPPLVAHRGNDVYAPAPGVEIAEVFGYYDGPLSGFLSGADGASWVFECLEWDHTERRFWRYHPLERGVGAAAALAVVDALDEGGRAADSRIRTGVVTYALSEGSAVTQAIAATTTVDPDVIRTAARGSSPWPDGVVDIDSDIYVVCLQRVGADPGVVEAARRYLAARPDYHVADPAVGAGDGLATA